MSDTAVAAYDKRPDRIDRLTPKVRKAIELMVWDGKPFNEAAQEVGLTSRAMRLALGKPFVLAAMKRELQVLRESEQPRNIHRLVEIREAAPNMPAVQAIRDLMHLSDNAHGSQSAASTSPGITIRIINQAPAAMVDVTPIDAQLTRDAIEHVNSDDGST
jgi:hypothetical protein